MRPITGGTTNSPPYASTEISEAAAAELTPSRRPARLKRSGTTEAKARLSEAQKPPGRKRGFHKNRASSPHRRSETAARHQHTLCKAPPQELADETADNGSGRKGGKGRCRRILPGTCHQKQGAPLGRCTFR